MSISCNRYIFAVFPEVQEFKIVKWIGTQDISLVHPGPGRPPERTSTSFLLTSARRWWPGNLGSRLGLRPNSWNSSHAAWCSSSKCQIDSLPVTASDIPRWKPWARRFGWVCVSLCEAAWLCRYVYRVYDTILYYIDIDKWQVYRLRV